MLYWHVFDKISSEFCGISYVFVNFAAPRPFLISEALILWAASFTLYKLTTKIYLSWPYFFSWSPKGYLRIFLILSPVWVALLCFIFLNFLVIMLFLLRSIAFLKKESILFMVIITLKNDSLPTSAQSSYQSYSPQMELSISNCKISFLIYFSLSR